MDSSTKSTYCTLVNKSDNLKYLCYFHTKDGLMNIGVTNATDVWCADFTEETLSQHLKAFSLKSPEGLVSKIRSACRIGSAGVSTEEGGDGPAVLNVGDGLGVTLSRLGEPRAREQLRDLLFQMADSLTHLDSTVSQSPAKSQHRAEFEPRRPQSGPVVAAKKRLPGSSLINPGSRRKRSATGVAFEDNDDL